MKLCFILAVLVVLPINSAHASDVGCVSTTFNALSPNDKVCISVWWINLGIRSSTLLSALRL